MNKQPRKLRPEADSSASKVIYVCHPFRGDPSGNRRRIAAVCRSLAAHGDTPIAPQLSVPEYLDESSERELALDQCLRVLELVDEVWVYGNPTEGMKREINAAKMNRIELRYLDRDGHMQSMPQ